MAALHEWTLKPWCRIAHLKILLAKEDEINVNLCFFLSVMHILYNSYVWDLFWDDGDIRLRLDNLLPFMGNVCTIHTSFYIYILV